MDSRDLTEARAYYSEYAFTHEIQELYLAQVAHVIYSTTPGAKRKPLSDFMLTARKPVKVDDGSSLKAWGAAIKAKEAALKESAKKPKAAAATPKAKETAKRGDVGDNLKHRNRRIGEHRADGSGTKPRRKKR